MPRTPSRLLWTLVLGGALLSSTVARAEIVERIVAVVNDRIVLLSELNTRVREYLPKLAQIRDPKMRMRQLRLLQQRELVKLVDAILIEEEGKKRKLTVSSADVDRAIRTVLRQNKLTRAELIATLAQEGYPFDSYRQDLRRQILRLKTINLAVRSRVSVSWTEVRAHYQKSVARMGVGLKLKLSQVFLRVDRSATGRYSLSSQRSLAHRLAGLIRAGRSSVAAVARRFSDDPETRARGGSLGFVGRGSLPPQVEAAVFAVKGAKKVVGPVATDSGFYLVYIHERRESEALPFDKIKRRLKSRLYRLRVARRTAAWVKSLRHKALIDLRM